jgi:hypothetical protein
MSIKTSKRIALGVIASLVFAPFAAIAPASAADLYGTVTLDNTTTTFSGRIGNQVSITVTGDIADLAATTSPEINNLVIAAATISQPNGSAVLPDLADSGSPATTLDNAPTDTAATSSSAARLSYAALTTEAIAATPNASVATLTLTPTHVGKYVVRVWNETSATTTLSGAESYLDFTINVTDGPTSIALSVTNSSAVKWVDADNNNILTATEFGAYGSLVKVTLTDATGATAALAVGEVVTIDPTLGATVGAVNGTLRTDAVTVGGAYNLTASDFTNGVAWVNIVDETAEISVVSATYGTFTTNASITFRTVETAASTPYTVEPEADSTGWYSTDSNAYSVPLSASITLELTDNDATDDNDFTSTEYGAIRVADTSGKVFGTTLTTLLRDHAVINGGTLTLSAAFTATGQAFKVSDDMADAGVATANLDNTFTSAARDLTTGGAVTLTPSGSIVANTAGSITVTALVEDQFGTAYANGRVTLAIAGRNGTQATQSSTTNASGYASFTVTDAAASTVTATVDTITVTAFDEDTSENATLTVTWGTVSVATITLGGGNNSATGTALATPAIMDIKAGSGGAEDGIQDITATIKDANGSVVAGVPVAWTVSDAGTKANILSTRATTYSSSQGVATTSVYAWINGTYTVTATAGGVTATVTVDFRQTSGGGEERTISAAASGRVVTATVKDRFGNPVPGVTVYATAPAGNAYLGAGSKSADLATNVNGEAAFVVGGADATITVSTINPATVGGVGSGQTCAAATKVSCAATATALTAPTAGTATTAETNVGNNIAPAGVATATASVTGITPAEPVVAPEKPTLSVVKNGGRVYLSGTAVEGEGDIIIYVKRVGTTAWKERAKTLEVAAPGDFNGSIRAPKNNVVIRVKQEGTGLFSNQVIVLK